MSGVLILLYSDETALKSDNGEVIGVYSTRLNAEAAMQTHAVEHQRRGHWYIEEWDIDGAFVEAEEVYPV